MRLAASTWEDVDRAPRSALVVPLGATEQHGPHLPLDTDTRIALAVAEAIAAAVDGASVAPALPVGASGEHAAFPGTLSIGPTALELLLVELVRHASADWDHVLVVNAHGGNVEAVRAAVRRLREEGRSCAAFDVAPAGADLHAGHAETSLLLHLDPGAVRLDRAVAGDPRPLAELLGSLRADGVRACSPTGVLGDPRSASPESGRRLLAEVVAAGRARLEALVAG